MLYQGDCLDIMPTMQAESVDSIVTDPPYGLSFMGKSWDHGVPGVPFWEAALRVAKPGCHLLAFGGTRTHHRLMVAIEDAGWEIRDCIFWCFGSGFPKSKNIGCKCGGGTLQYSHEEKGLDSCKMQHLRDDVSEASLLGEKDKESLLRLQLQRERTGEGTQEAQREHEGQGAERQTIWSRESRMERRGDVLAETRQLQADKVCEVPGSVSTDGSERRLYNGTSPIDGEGTQLLPSTNGSSASQKPRSSRQPHRKSSTVCVEQSPQDSRICPKCGGIIDRVGYGTALKPAYEMIVLARKPIIGTVAANVLKYGTGAMNIDASRIPFEDTPNPATNPLYRMEAGYKNKQAADTGSSSYSMKAEGSETLERNINKLGRWPANLIHDGSDEVVGLFPQSAGQMADVPIDSRKTKDVYGVYDHNSGMKARNDSGSAARFFYCAKASRSERGEENNHPTVKPLALMQYLCRLVTVPGGVVFDPFAGSGSTGKAAILGGFQFSGIELEKENAEIAERRINSVQPLFQAVM